MPPNKNGDSFSSSKKMLKEAVESTCKHIDKHYNERLVGIDWAGEPARTIVSQWQRDRQNEVWKLISAFPAHHLAPPMTFVKMHDRIEAVGETVDKFVVPKMELTYRSPPIPKSVLNCQQHLDIMQQQVYAAMGLPPETVKDPARQSYDAYRNRQRLEGLSDKEAEMNINTMSRNELEGYLHEWADLPKSSIQNADITRLRTWVTDARNRWMNHPEQRCPKCDGGMQRRTAHRGLTEGKEFFGCKKYPKCDGTRTVREWGGTEPMCAAIQVAAGPDGYIDFAAFRIGESQMPEIGRRFRAADMMAAAVIDKFIEPCSRAFEQLSEEDVLGFILPQLDKYGERIYADELRKRNWRMLTTCEDALEVVLRNCSLAREAHNMRVKSAVLSRGKSAPNNKDLRGYAKTIKTKPKGYGAGMYSSTYNKKDLSYVEYEEGRGGSIELTACCHDTTVCGNTWSDSTKLQRRGAVKDFIEQLIEDVFSAPNPPNTNRQMLLAALMQLRDRPEGMAKQIAQVAECMLDSIKGSFEKATRTHVQEQREQEVAERTKMFQVGHCKRCGRDTGCMCPREEPKPVKSTMRCKHPRITQIPWHIALELVPTYTFTKKDRVHACDTCHSVVLLNNRPFGK